jgi:5-oxoprolinase (ATP-hydrolysing)
VYVLRLLIDEDLPLNEGLLAPVELRIPESLLSPRFTDDPADCPAVAGGNVEISQLVVETMLTALGLSAQSQGTMNNVVFGAGRYGFYETLGGGCGALAGFPGESAVHSHMTNTVLTDAELLEFRYPVRLERSAVRIGSGGEGAARGGDGLDRRYRFLAETMVAVLRARKGPPSGRNGGKPASLGACFLVSGPSDMKNMGSQTHSAPPDSLLCVETPGGGGFGEISHGEPAQDARPAPTTDV